jgi:hypothetical protein
LDICEDLKLEPVLAVFAGYAWRRDHVEAGADVLQTVGHAHMNVQNPQFGGSTVKDRRMSTDPTRRFDYSGVTQQRFISLSICGERGFFPKWPLTGLLQALRTEPALTWSSLRGSAPPQ